ncbi:acyltransferase family protein [Humitalea sp. 24SJ18S-53]|uniref:acyltransferase family protein n=1 Tax=Humitalea sp. 24SJ18S-53 TaxID=3422307 RepID=UPI003D673C59
MDAPSEKRTTIVHPVTSLYLDAVRFSAAMLVLVGHLAAQRFTDGLFWQVAPYKADAVTVFFVLSGYVIAYVSDGRETTARSYAMARVARIASVGVPALVLAYWLDRWGMMLRPDLQAAGLSYDVTRLEQDYLRNVVFLGRIWFDERLPGSMGPWWSLNYEVWYYVAFGLILFARGAVRLTALGLLLLVLGPFVALHWPIWLMGVGAYALRDRLSPRAGLWLALLAAVAILPVAGWGFPPLEFPVELTPAALGRRYAIGGLFAAHLIGVAAAAPMLGRPPRWLVGAVRWLAGATFTIYLLHLPVAHFLTTVLPWPPRETASRAAMYGITLVVLFAVAAVTERRKDLWRRWIEALAARSVPMVKKLAAGP